jgi:hypothetical protein
VVNLTSFNTSPSSIGLISFAEKFLIILVLIPLIFP